MFEGTRLTYVVPGYTGLKIYSSSALYIAISQHKITLTLNSIIFYLLNNF